MKMLQPLRNFIWTIRLRYMKFGIYTGQKRLIKIKEMESIMNVTDKVRRYLKAIEKDNKKVNAILHVNEKAIEEAKEIDERVAKTGKKGKLYGYVFAVKSNINVLGLPANCASRVLENYIATYDATVIEKIRAEDGVIIGMTNMDEFALGSSGENSAF